MECCSWFGWRIRSTLSIYDIVGIQQKDRFNKQLLNDDSFFKPPVKFAECVKGTETCSDAGLKIYYAQDEYNEDCSQVVSCFNYLTEDDILQPYKS